MSSVPNGKAQRVWATRPAQQNSAWSELLRAQGFEVIETSLMAIEPITEPDDLQAIKNTILDFDQFQKVMFVSQNAVAAAFNWLETYWPQLPAGIHYYAVGKKTAEAVSQQGVSVVSADVTMNSEELLALPEMQDVWGQKVLVCRGKGGLPRFGDELKSRGAIVRYLELYQRKIPDNAESNVSAALEESSEWDIIPVFSGETLENLERIFKHCACDRRDMLLVVPGKRVAELAQKLGFTRVNVAANASEAAMMEAIVSTANAALDH